MTRRSSSSTRTRSSIRAATRRSRWSWCSTPAAVGRAAVPSGASTGAHEAVELRDGEKDRYGGKGVRKAVDQRPRDHRPGAAGPGRGRPGGHRRAAHRPRRHAQQGQAGRQRHPGRVARLRPRRGRGVRPAALPLPGRCRRANTLPVPMFNILNGGKHAVDSTDFQEFMVMPIGAPTFSEALRAGSEIFHALREGAARRRLRDRPGRRGRLRAVAGIQRRRPSRSCSRPSSGPATSPGEDVVDRARSRRRPSWSTWTRPPTRTAS